MEKAFVSSYTHAIITTTLQKREDIATPGEGHSRAVSLNGIVSRGIGFGT
jgi:hypothetical protein